MNQTNEIITYAFSGSGAATTAYTGAGALTMTTTAQPVACRLLGTLWIHVTTIASSALKLTVKVTTDSAGQLAVLPDQIWVPTSYNTGNIGTLVYPFTLGQTATNGSVVIPVNSPCYFTGTTLYLWVKTDTGTCTVTSANLTAVL